MKRAFLFPFLLALALDASAADPKTAQYHDVQANLREIAKRHSSNARVFELGLSDSGQLIEGLAIGQGPVKNLVVATHHGNEYGSTEVAQAFARAIAETPIEGQTVYVIPVLNVSGYNAKKRWESAGSRTFDPNRNYPGPCATDGPFTLRSTKALADFIEREKIVTAATLHTYTPAVVYPWGHSTRDTSTPYDDLFLRLVKLATEVSGYEVGNSAEVIYPADGTFEDYAFWKHGIWSILFELGRSHSPDDREIAEMVRVNVPGLRKMLAGAPASRAENHDFTGRCDVSLRVLDRHDE